MDHKWGSAMGELWKRTTSALFGDFEKSAFFRSLALGIAFSILITVILGAIQGILKLTKEFPYFEVAQQAYWIGIVFISFSLLFAFVGYLSALNARDDLLTPLRKKLVGYWEIQSQTWLLQDQKIEFGWTTSHSTIGIEPVSGKLLMHFDLSESDIFKDQAFNVAATAFSLDAATRKLVYFHEAALELKRPIGTAPDLVHTIEFPFVGVLKLIENDDGRIDRMQGRWYDINNCVYNLARRIDRLQGFEQLREAVETGAVTFGGEIKFKRLKSLPGMPKD
jgi:hypothetical protein